MANLNNIDMPYNFQWQNFSFSTKISEKYNTEFLPMQLSSGTGEHEQNHLVGHAGALARLCPCPIVKSGSQLVPLPF